MRHAHPVLRCDGCGVEITWAPVVVEKSFRARAGITGPLTPRSYSYYCCQDCAEGRVCSCSERMDEDDRRR